MKNIIKALVIFASVVAFSSANAGVLEVTGTAKATYNISGSDSASAVNEGGKAIGITNELAFTGTGELDNGYTWKYQVELDDTAAGTFSATDDTRLELTTPYGVIAAYNTEGSLNTKYKFSAAAYGAVQIMVLVDLWNTVKVSTRSITYNIILLQIYYLSASWQKLLTRQVQTMVKDQVTQVVA